MNFLKRAITKAPHLRLFSSRPSRNPPKCIFLIQPITHQSSSYSTTYRLKPPHPTKPTRTRKPQAPPSSEETLADWPRPSEIPFQAKVANLVNLIGHVKNPVEFKSSSDGKCWAATSISQDNGLGVSCLIPVLFEGDLANVVYCHIKKNDCVYVSGQLSKDPVPFVLSESQGSFHVLVQNINFVQGFEKRAFDSKSNKKELSLGDENASSDYMVDGNGRAESVGFSMRLGKDNTDQGTDDNVKNLWKDLVAEPQEWWDIRSEIGVGPAFEHKDTGRVLTIDYSTPDWILKRLECIDFEKKNFQTSQKVIDTKKEGMSVFDSWRDLVKNPKQWWDYREQKFKGSVSAKFPDFKHKDSGTPLWIGTAPNWILPGLERLEVDVFAPKEKQVKDAKQVASEKKQVKDAKEEFWKSLVENPNQWWDNRLGKKNVKAPDFKHKETGEALWLNSSPEWALSKLPPLKEKQ